MTEERLLYRPEEAAQVLGLSRARLYELMARGEVRSVKIGASRRVPLADLEAFVQRLRAQYGGNAPGHDAPADALVS
jgi:excisionase family DNA binding protein